VRGDDQQRPGRRLRHAAQRPQVVRQGGEPRLVVEAQLDERPRTTAVRNEDDGHALARGARPPLGRARQRGEPRRSGQPPHQRRAPRHSILALVTHVPASGASCPTGTSNAGVAPRALGVQDASLRCESGTLPGGLRARANVRQRMVFPRGEYVRQRGPCADTRGGHMRIVRAAPGAQCRGSPRARAPLPE
jgi:hypothetical protein